VAWLTQIIMNIKKLILSCFGLGFLPLAPGTWGSLLALAVFLAVRYFWPVAIISVVLLWIMIVLSSVFCLLFAGKAEELEEKKDPGWIVIDEFAGQSVALLSVAVTSGKILAVAIAGFVLFRIFDILKPPPVREIQYLKGGLGILADDLVAGVMAGVVICIVSFLVTFAQ
jgi:phosphatidylglycerophosphatase A